MSLSKDRAKSKGGLCLNRAPNISTVIIAIICVSVGYIAYSTLSLGSHDTMSGAQDVATAENFSDKLIGRLTGNDPASRKDIMVDSAHAISSKDKSKIYDDHNRVHTETEVIRCPFPGGEAKWCDVPAPSKSHFGFSDAPNDPKRWRIAQILASKGEQVLLQRIVKHFPHAFDYIDGDRSFRGLQKLVDIFVDSKTGLDPLLPESGNDPELWSHVRRRLQEEGGGDEMKSSGDTVKALHVNGKQVAPLPYNFRISNRAPLVEMGYTAFDKNLNTFFSGNFAGGNFVKKEWFFDRWAEVKSKLDVPFITMCSLNENWGVLSTNFPNRTAGWGACCNKPSDRVLHEFLAHDKTLMFIINQHSNLSHPKLLTLPRGLPTQWEHTARVVWDTQRYLLKHVKKTKLLFAASSSWGKRPQILRCISDKMAVDDFWGHSDAPKEHVEDQKKTKSNRRLYYQKLGSAMIGVALPGLGYDCFRTWELLTLGSLVVLERGVGLDRTLWRLPALLVEDFDDITPALLHSAYVEALYRADEFEFERLTQSFWYGVIANVSYSKSVQPMLDKFPMEAELPNFARPKVPYACSNTNTCGKGTKRTPRNMC
jgi:hypothetical protein